MAMLPHLHEQDGKWKTEKPFEVGEKHACGTPIFEPEPQVSWWKRWFK